MSKIELEDTTNGEQRFTIKEGAERIAEMVIRISGKEIAVLHTEVDSKHEGQGLAKELLQQWQTMHENMS